jgi:capsular exopolysaccharide synthesis family protein
MSSQLPTQPEAGLPISPGGAEAQGFVPLDPSSGESHEAKTPQILRYLAAVRRHRWLVLGVTLVGGVLGLAASRFVDPTYQAQATLWVEQPGQDKQGPIQTDQLLESSGWRDLLYSYVVLDHVVSDERLFIRTDPPSDHEAFAKFKLQPRFIPGDYRLEVSSDGRTFTLSSNGTVLEQGRVGEPVGQKAGFDWAPTAKILQPKRVLDFEVVNPRDVSVQLASQINATPPQKGGNFMRLSLAGTDATEISHTLNAVAERYVSVAADLKRAKLVQLTDLLEEQLEYAAQNLRDAESALKTFQIQTITLPSDQGTPVAPGLQATQAPVMSRYFEMKVQRDQLQQDREAIERILTEARSSPAALDGLVMVSSVQNAPALMGALTERDKARAGLRVLLERYTPEYKDVKEAKANLETLERQTIPQLARELTSQLLARESEFDSTIGSASAELREIPSRSIEEARLVRQVATAENLHKMLKNRYEEARLAAVSSIPDIRILDRAVVPFRPVQDQRPMLIALGFLGSFGLALVGVILVDRIDPRVRYPEEITGGMGLAILGAIPNVKHLESPGGRNETTAHAAEAFRELRLNLIYAHGTAGPLLLTITSPGSGDGKSFTTSNLALAFADQGYRTLVIDGDIRRGSLHRTLGGRRAPGLTDFLAGEATKEEVLQSTDFPNISFIGAGTRMARGPELLGSAAMSRLLLDLRGQFDAVLVDSAPLGAGVDAFALGTHTRNLLLVVRTGSTDRALAQAKLELLDRLPIRLLGAVMNGTPSDSGIYRYYSYLPGYEVEEEKGVEDEKDAEEALQLGPG